MRRRGVGHQCSLGTAEGLRLINPRLQQIHVEERHQHRRRLVVHLPERREGAPGSDLHGEAGEP